MATTIKIKNSVTATTTPTSLVQGEVAINVTDKKVWVGNAATTPIQIVGAGTTGNAAGSNTQVQYNSSGSFAGDADFTFNGTTVTMANDASISGLTVGKGGGAVSSNTAFGVNALTANEAGGTNNTAIGNAALDSNTTGDANTALGQDALQANTTASNNTAVGYQAAYSSTVGRAHAFGYQAAYSNTGEYVTAFGYQSLKLSTGGANVAFGHNAASATTTGATNSAFGHDVMLSNTTGSSNVAMGTEALRSNTTASANTAVGAQAGYSGTTATNTSVFGYNAGYSITTGSDNTLLGTNAGRSVTTGVNNVMVGSAAGYWINLVTTGSYNTYVGYGVNASAVGVNNEVIVGYNGTGKGDGTGFMVGGNGFYQSNNSASWSTTSDERLKKNIVDNKAGLEIINKIQVRNFEYRVADEVTDLPKEQVIDKAGVQLGVIAQELQAVLPDCVKEQSTGVLTVDTDSLTWYLINAVKELKAEIDQLKGN